MLHPGGIDLAIAESPLYLAIVCLLEGCLLEVLIVVRLSDVDSLAPGRRSPGEMRGGGLPSGRENPDG